MRPYPPMWARHRAARLERMGERGAAALSQLEDEMQDGELWERGTSDGAEPDPSPMPELPASDDAA